MSLGNLVENRFLAGGRRFLPSFLFVVVLFRKERVKVITNANLAPEF